MWLTIRVRQPRRAQHGSMRRCQASSTRAAAWGRAMAPNLGRRPDFRARRAAAGRHLSRLTPRAMTRTDSISAETDSTAISILARGDSGIVSVGLNAEEFVTET